MTSKTLSINLFKGELKRKLWLIIISLLFLIFTGPMSLLIKIDNLLIWSSNSSKNQLIRQLAPSLSNSNELTLVICIILACIFAYTMFNYLYSRQAVDLYHSLAIDRKHMFTVFTLTGLLPAYLLLLIDTLLKIAVLAVKKLINSYIINIAFSTLLYEFVFFTMIFMITLTAVLICGNRFMGIALTLGLLMLPSVFQGMLNNYKSYCFQSYQGVNLSFNWILFILSPASQFTMYENVLSAGFAKVIVSFIEVIILTFLAFFLYKIRPSECNHQALCYNALEPVIRIPAVIIAALSGGIYVVYVSGTLPSRWYILSFILVGLITHILINSIIKGDVRKSLSNWPEILISMAASAVIASVFLYDLTGYDTYLPSMSDIESAGIVFEPVDSSIGNYDIEYDGENYALNYLYYVDYRLSHMNTNDIKSIYDLAKLGIENQDKTKSVFKRHMPEDENKNSEETSQDNSEDFYFIIKFHLKSGRDVVRNYKAPASAVIPLMDSIYNSKEYKDSLCQLDEYIEKKPFGKINATDRFYEECFSLEGEDIYLLLDALKKDYYNMTFDTLVNEDPIIAFNSLDNNGYYAEGLSGYYIYPSSKNTLDFLKSKGININTDRDIFDTSRIQSINVEKYYDSASAHATYSPDSDREIVDAIHKCMVIDTFSYDNSILRNYENNITITVNYLTENGYIRSFCVRVPKGSLPEQVYSDVSEDKIL